MSNGLNPIFEDIFKGIINNKSNSEPISETTILLMDSIGNDSDFDTLDLLRDFINEVKDNPKGVILEIDKKCEEIEKNLIENGICPICGGALASERDEELDNYVPYGDTQVLETYGITLICNNCGYRRE